MTTAIPTHRCLYCACGCLGEFCSEVCSESYWKEADEESEQSEDEDE